MSSIAYVADEKMIEYHRLFGSRNINFWRLSSQKRFKDFKKGDLLFFYTRSEHSKKKGFVGYAHYDSTERMSLKRMWKKYEQKNGYDNFEQLKDAIQTAARDNQIPEEMNCLYLTDVVFFVAPIYPEDIGIKISPKLESYCYLDQNDPQVTVRLLKLAEKVGIDIWSAAQSKESVNVFRKDEIRHHLAVCAKEIGESGLTKAEQSKARKLTKTKLDDSFEQIRGSENDYLKIEDRNIIIAIPFAYMQKDYNIRKLELMGKLTLYKLYILRNHLDVDCVKFRILTEQPQPEIIELVEEFLHA